MSRIEGVPLTETFCLLQLAPAIALQSKSTMIKIAANRIKMILQGNTKHETC